MNSGTHGYVLDRDRRCILHDLDWSHVCRDMWGEPHPADDRDKLTVEHVREHPGGMRRDDPGWLVAMCHEGNVSHAGSTTETRTLLNVYLRGVRAQERMQR